MIYLSVPILLQALLIIHVIKTNRDSFWIYILIFIPIAGGIAYLVVEILPSARRSRATSVAQSTLTRIMSPDKEFGELESAAQFSPTVQNRSRLADEYLRRGRYEEAIELYDKCLSGPFSDNVEIMLSLARAHYATGEWDRSAGLLAKIDGLTAQYPRSDAEFLRAQVLERLGETDQAKEFFSRAAAHGQGLEYKYRYGNFLLNSGDKTAAYQQYQEILDSYQRMSRFSRKQNRQWIQCVESDMRSV